MILENSIIDKILQTFKGKIGKDFDVYRNHVYRVFNFASLLDTEFEPNQATYAIASAYHDLGIWTHNTFDYLEPTIGLAKKYLSDEKLERLEDEIILMIDMHHKMSRYSGPFTKTVETFRRADWIDVSMGLMKFQLSPKRHDEIKKAFPYLGFHRFLLKQTFKRFLKHPLDPLPMFKK